MEGSEFQKRLLQLVAQAQANSKKLSQKDRAASGRWRIVGDLVSKAADSKVMGHLLRPPRRSPEMDHMHLPGADGD
tara:strand:- start:533 stop:760 length:228 start_codon:yes stop_codon:yes gene_type:complete